MLLPDVHAVGPVHELVGGAALVAEGLELLDEPVLLQLGLGVESGLGIGLGLGLGLGMGLGLGLGLGSTSPSCCS